MIVNYREYLLVIANRPKTSDFNVLTYSKCLPKDSLVSDDPSLILHLLFHRIVSQFYWFPGPHSMVTE